MSMPKASPDHGASKDSKRNLPSWITARDDESTSQGKKLLDDAVNEDSEENATRKRAKGHGKSVKNNDEVDKAKKATSAGSITRDFSKLLEGVVFVLSGFVNPERSILRSQALEMGAEYHPDWDPNCTLLVCAFPNTPKFQQVEADCGTIVSKEWITECYNQKKLVDIESYLMHVGKPWRKNNMADADKEELKLSLARKSEKHKEKVPNLEPNTSSSSKALKSEPSESIQEKFSPLKVKKWAIDDLNKTISWLENQAEKPEPNEIRQVAAEGILTCLQDAIDLLEQQEDVSKLTEQWSMIPHAVEELILAQANTNRSPSTSKYDLRDQATVFKRIYEGELKGVLDNSTPENKNPKPKRRENVKGKNSDSDTVAECDSDETIEMNEEEIELAYNSIVSKVPA